MRMKRTEVVSDRREPEHRLPGRSRHVDITVAVVCEPSVERFELRTRVTADQAHAFETAFARLDGVRIRPIAEASNQAIDATPDSGNTVTVAAPGSSDVVTDGDYIVLAWQSERINDAFQQFDLEVAKK
jgi:hypothetical protein